MNAGEEKLWKDLVTADPDDVCRRTPAEWDAAANIFRLSFFAWEVTVNRTTRGISSNDEQAGEFLKRYRYFAPLAILQYLVRAQPIEPSGKMIKPGDLGTGQVYYQGSHALPLEKVAAAHQKDARRIPDRAAQLGAETLTFGDLSFRLLPLPRLPVTFILWSADDEFPARADFLFDATCERHLEPDVLWAVAMMTTLALL